MAFDVYGISDAVNGAELFMKPEHIKAQIAIFNEIERQNPFTQTIERPADI